MALLGTLDWRGVVVGVALVAVIRPLAGYLALAPWARAPSEPGGMTNPEMWATSFFGVRGVGSLFYLAYAAGESGDLGADWMWSTVAFTLVLSVMVHGVLATPVMKRIDLAHGR